MVIIAQRVVKPESPPLTSFLEGLQLFADAFESSGGFRLTRIARPPILFYGLYGTTTLEDADRRLLELIVQRGLLADELDCFLQCGCSPENIRCQVVLDKILYDVDRAIDLYALGKDNFGEPERRAAAFSFVIEHFLDFSPLVNRNSGNNGKCKIPNLATYSDAGKATEGILVDIKKQLRPKLTFEGLQGDPDLDRVVSELLAFAREVRDISPATSDLKGDLGPDAGPGLIKTLDDIAVQIRIDQLTPLFTRLKENDALKVIKEKDLTPPTSVELFLTMLQQELCIQEDMEERWRNLVKSMAPNCFGIDKVLDAVEKVIEGAIDLVSGERCPIFLPSIPPHYETTLDGIANDVDPLGGGR